MARERAMEQGANTMRSSGKAILAGALALALPFSTACSSSSGGGAVEAPPTGVYAGTYEVPVPAELAAAATYAVPEIEWTRSGDAVTLAYALPLGRVGDKVRVKFEGTLGAALTGEAGTATCEVAAEATSCHEVMTGLLPITPDYDVIAKEAAAEPGVDAALRAEIAKRFSVDPIGIVHLDPSAKVAAEPGG
jgi:hypothetical protein